MPVRYPLPAFAIVLALVASGLAVGELASAAPTTQLQTTAVTPAPGGYRPPPVNWAPCPKSDGFAKDFQCGTVIVPADWNKLSGAKISLALTRVPHTAKPYQGIMLVNPGGPGESGRSLANLGQYVPNHGGDGYDWIGFDPRGVDASTPHLDCEANYTKAPLPAYEPTTKAREQAWITKIRAYDAACGAKNGALLGQITTENTAKDIDAIRVALGQEQINYFGFSYGTYLGQVYATLFPSHLRRTVFDSTVDPRGIWYPFSQEQDVAYENTIHVFFTWIAKYNRVYHLGKTEAAVSSKYYATVRQLTRHHAGKIGGDEFTDSVTTAVYAESTWPGIAQFFSDWAVKHSIKALKAGVATYDGTVSNSEFATFNAIECNDANDYPASFSIFAADERRLNRVAPFSTWPGGWYTADCIPWPAKRSTPVEVNGSGVASVLMIDETLDAPTPYAGSLEVRRRFPNAVLLAEPGGTSHAASLYGNACVDDTIAAYLKNGTLPTRKAGDRSDKTCKPTPPPKPTTAKPVNSSRSGASRLAPVLLRSGALR